MAIQAKALVIKQAGYFMLIIAFGLFGVGRWRGRESRGGGGAGACCTCREGSVCCIVLQI